jgi:hypothetical protein
MTGLRAATCAWAAADSPQPQNAIPAAPAPFRKALRVVIGSSLESYAPFRPNRRAAQAVDQAAFLPADDAMQPGRCHRCGEPNSLL